MLNPFPYLLSLQFILITLLRIVLGFTYLWFGYQMTVKDRERAKEFVRLAKLPFPTVLGWVYGIIQFVGGILFLVGLFVQPTAIALSIVSFSYLLLKDRKHPYLKNDFAYYILLFTMTFAMLFFGAGAFSIDIPL